MSPLLVIKVGTTEILHHEEKQPLFGTLKVIFIHRPQKFIIPYLLVEIMDKFPDIFLADLFVKCDIHLKNDM